MSATGRSRPVSDVMCETKTAFVRSVTCSNSSSYGTCTNRQSRCHARTHAPYSRSVDSTSSSRRRLERPRRHVHARRRVLDERQVVGPGADVAGQLAAGLGEEAVQPAGDELHRLAFELQLPGLVPLEDGPRRRPERAVVEERDRGVEEEELFHCPSGADRSVVARCTRAPGRSVRARTRCRPELASSLGISELTAGVLVRRGYDEPASARAFLAGEMPPHDPFLLGDMEAACARIRAAVAEGRRICVHGDYDVDGIAATALAVLLLRELGADVDWHLPSRFDEGYGVRSETLARLADEGCALVLTVDCGITAVEEVAEASARGLEVIVTDHHRPGDALPDCPIVATRPSDYPFPELCGTGVVYKLGQALFGVDSDFPKRHLDLVALATIADVVPLLDENRSLAIAGLRALARTQKPGLQALMRAAGVDPAAVDAGAVGFRLAPRINAAGRLGHPRAALELLLTTDPAEAAGSPTRSRSSTASDRPSRSRILREAIAKVEAWPDADRRRHALRRRGRGLARGRHRHRRLAARRAVQPAGRPDRGDARRRLEGLRPLDSAPSTFTPASAPAPTSSAAGAATGPPPASRSTPRTSRPSRRASQRTPTRSSSTTTSSR